MGLEEYIQPVVTVAAFDPITDEVATLKRSDQAINYPGFNELLGGKVEELDGDLLSRITLEVWQEIEGIIAEEHLISAETIAIKRTTRAKLLSYRFCGALKNRSNLRIPSEETHEHPSFQFVNSQNFRSLSYVPEVEGFLARLFQEHARTGTLLSTLKQPIYLRPTFLDYERNRAFIPIEERKGGLPRTYLREEHKHVDEVLGDIVHEYLGLRRRQAQVTRMEVAAKKLVWGKHEIPAWLMNYGIAVSSDVARTLATDAKVVELKMSAEGRLNVKLPECYSPEARAAVIEMRKSIAEALILRNLKRVNFNEQRKALPTFI